MQSSTGSVSFLSRIEKKCWSPVDNSLLIVFRIVFGALLFYHCISFITSGKLFENFIQPPITFTYIGFEFLQPLPGNGMYFYFGLMAVLALMIMIGAWYRVAMTGFSILWIIIYLMQKSNYNNHYYLILLLCFLMCFMPAHTYFSVDAVRKKTATANCQLPIANCPQWVVWLFMSQAGIIYFFAGISKLTSDWLSGKFIAIQFTHYSYHHILGPLYSNRIFQLMICYGGLLFDLLIVPLLLWKKTRYYAFILLCGFHLFNAYSFRIGIFPYLSIAMALFFLDPEKISRLLFKKKTTNYQLSSSQFPVGSLQPAPSISKNFSNSPTLNCPLPTAHCQLPTQTLSRRIFIYGLCFYLLLQLLLPIRSWFYPGNVFWTEEGYRMSWKMMLRVKTGTIHFKVTDSASQKKWIVDPAERFAPSHVQWIAIAPDIAWQYAQQLKKEFSEKGYPGVAIYAIDSVSLNKNPPQLLIDTSVDLGRVKWNVFGHSKWIRPFREEK